MGKRAFDEITNLRKRLVSRGCALGILVALLIGTTGVVVVNEIQKKQAPGTSEKPEQKVHDQPKSSKNDELASTKLETKDKTQPAKVKQPPKARNFQAEMEEALLSQAEKDKLLKNIPKK